MSGLAATIVSAVLLSAGVPSSTVSVASPSQGALKWARGVVVATGPDTLVLKLRDRELVLGQDASAAVLPGTSMAFGSVVEVHYRDAKGVRQAVLIYGDGTAAAAGMSKRPGLSVLGVVQRTRRGSLSVTINAKRFSVAMNKRTRLLDRDGRALAEGAKAIAPLLASGQRLLVKYNGGSGDMMVGDLFISGSSDEATEIRLIDP